MNESRGNCPSVSPLSSIIEVVYPPLVCLPTWYQSQVRVSLLLWYHYRSTPSLPTSFIGALMSSLSSLHFLTSSTSADFGLFFDFSISLSACIFTVVPHCHPLWMLSSFGKALCLYHCCLCCHCCCPLSAAVLLPFISILSYHLEQLFFLPFRVISSSANPCLGAKSFLHARG